VFLFLGEEVLSHWDIYRSGPYGNTGETFTPFVFNHAVNTAVEFDQFVPMDVGFDIDQL
jgi:hypothetical protein